jgi:hypothetical protein
MPGPLRPPTGIEGPAIPNEPGACPGLPLRAPAPGTAHSRDPLTPGAWAPAPVYRGQGATHPRE